MAITGEMAALAVATLLMGFAKAGFPNSAALISVPLIMAALPSAEATAVTLLLMMACDIPAAWVHRHNFVRERFLPILLPTAVGIVLTSILWWFAVRQGAESRSVNVLIKQMVGGVSVVFAVYVLLKEYAPGTLSRVRWERISVWGWGLVVGITTTIANASGPVMGLYYYVHGLDQKEKFTGTMAWTFLLLNWIKLPCMVASGVVTWRAGELAWPYLVWIPAGVLLGQWMLRIVSQRLFNTAVAISGLLMGGALLMSWRS